MLSLYTKDSGVKWNFVADYSPTYNYFVDNDVQRS